MATTPTVNDMMEAYAQGAVEHSREAFGIGLDYSEASVRRVEEILGRLHVPKSRGLLAFLRRRKLPPEILEMLARIYGGYIGEVLRKVGGGEWFFDEEIAPGSTVIGLRKGADHRIWPPTKVAKRLTEGEEDNVWHYYQVIRQEW